MNARIARMILVVLLACALAVNVCVGKAVSSNQALAL
jgi:hypothetical protein